MSWLTWANIILLVALAVIIGIYWRGILAFVKAPESIVTDTSDPAFSDRSAETRKPECKSCREVAEMLVQVRRILLWSATCAGSKERLREVRLTIEWIDDWILRR